MTTEPTNEALAERLDEIFNEGVLHTHGWETLRLAAERLRSLPANGSGAMNVAEAALKNIAKGKLKRMDDGSTELIADPDVDAMDIAGEALAQIAAIAGSQS